MTGSASLIERIGEKLRQHHVQNLVLDPVMVSTSGRSLLPREGLEALTGLLFPLASLVTPNLPEAQVLCGWEISTEEQMEQAACQLGKKYGVSVLLKGGHRSEGANRPAVSSRESVLVFRRTGEESQYSRHWMYPFQRHCLWFGIGGGTA